MKALVKARAEEGLWLEEIPTPKAGPRDVVIKVAKASICGTDLHIYKWDAWAQHTIKVPMTIGHEFMGYIHEVGTEVEGISRGDRVTCEGHLFCGRCRACLAGKRHLCPNSLGTGIHRPGGFAEYVVVPMNNVWRLHNDVSDDVATILDPLGNAAHTALSFDVVGEDVLITGAGPIGIMAAKICQHNGARNVVLTDITPWRLDLARRLGIERVVDIRNTKLSEIREQLGMVGGFDIGLEMSGASVAFADMINHMYNGGRIALLGFFPNETAINWDQVRFKGLLLKGIYGREIFETWYKVEAMLRSKLDIAGIITHRFKFSDFQKAFDAVAKGETGKVILEL